MQTKELTLEEVKKLELELLLFIDKICKEHHIPYYLSSGTLLGAVKYQGFIPWDDDIDIILLRPDYMKLMKVLKEPCGDYRLLSIYHQKDYYYPFAKLVHTKTVLKENAKPIKNMGVYIDIVPMDGYYSKNIIKQTKKYKFIKNMAVRRFRIQNCIRGNFEYMKEKPIKYRKVKDIIYQVIDIISIPMGYTFWVKLLDKKISKVHVSSAKYLGVRTGNFGMKEAFLREDIIEQDTYQFEGHFFTSFKNYNLYLTQKYGNYQKNPKKEEQTTHHQFHAYWKDGNNG